MKALIAILPGDGIGPEVTEQATRVLERIARIGNHDLELRLGDIGAMALDWKESALPEETRDLCQMADAVLLGAVGGLRVADGVPRPEEGLLALRKQLGVYANLRPVRPLPQLLDASPVKAELLAGVDMLFVRELTGGIYFGNKERNADRAMDECVYTRSEIERVVRTACELARDRGRMGKVTSIDKANVLATSRLWRATAERVAAEEFPELTLEHVLVDAAAMRLIAEPASFDVIVTENMFGDILTDAASVLTGALGNLPSASLGAGQRGLFEPVHGSAPSIAGRGVANPYGAILSAALLLRHSLGLEPEAVAVERAVEEAIAEGARSVDLVVAGQKPMSTDQIGDAVLGRLRIPAES